MHPKKFSQQFPLYTQCRNALYTVHSTHHYVWLCGNLDSSTWTQIWDIQYRIAKTKEKQEQMKKKSKYVSEYIGSIEQLNIKFIVKMREPSQVPDPVNCLQCSKKIMILFLYLFLCGRLFVVVAFVPQIKRFHSGFLFTCVVGTLLNVSLVRNDKGGSGTSITQANQARFVIICECMYACSVSTIITHNFRNSLGIQFNLKSSAHVKTIVVFAYHMGASNAYSKEKRETVWCTIYALKFCYTIQLCVLRFLCTCSQFSLSIGRHLILRSADFHRTAHIQIRNSFSVNCVL